MDEEWKWRNPEFLSDDDWENIQWHTIGMNPLRMWAQFGAEHFAWIIELNPEVSAFLYGHVGMEEGDTMAFYPDSWLLPAKSDIELLLYVDQIMLGLQYKNDDPSPYFKIIALDGRIAVNGYNLDRASDAQLRKLRAATRIISPFLSAMPKAGAPKGNRNREIDVPESTLEEAKQKTYRYKDEHGNEWRQPSLEAFAGVKGISPTTIRKKLSQQK